MVLPPQIFFLVVLVEVKLLIIPPFFVGAVIGDGQSAVASNIANTTYRLQWWDFTKFDLPEISNGKLEKTPVPYFKTMLTRARVSSRIFQSQLYVAGLVCHVALRRVKCLVFWGSWLKACRANPTLSILYILAISKSTCKQCLFLWADTSLLEFCI